ncbi:spore germination protein [Metabacillus fastidiosus]|uniref:Spore germination protein n=1 Tax=Metabacillus fastidiosus TaxID=1458 RepID=A0ABU6P1B3_9BACI|nr:spore germination protein [Metabacillus fastidiosus]MED4403140.1 spore germination protein [Metabacillus fastidiosus]MED4455374.1 spore germination protein [Metabacillus fastidiosus]MED4461565.1 spore germination protein [Metabacillus fastidiosus]MED4533699.1 spore germination protein [Metabacillus fastidiosus]
MPAIVGVFKVNSVGTSSIVHIGDVITISPYSEVKTFAGAGSFSTGDGLNIYNQNSVTNMYDQDIVDQPVVGNM